MDKIQELPLDLKYRPRRLESIVGNDATKTLIKSLLSKGFPKFTILTGSTGSGKTTTAFIIAMTLLCEEGGVEPCFECSRCKKLLNDLYTKGKTSSSLGLFMYDMGLNSEQEYVNDIARGISTKSLNGNKVIILEELQRVKKDYQDALLRSLEFIPDGTYVMITTSEPFKLANALKSRALEIKFTYPTLNELQSYIKSIALEEGVALTPTEIKSIITYYNNNPRQILKGIEAIKNSDKTGLNNIINDRKEERVACFEYIDCIFKGMEDLLEFSESLDNKINFIKSLKYVLKDTIKSRYKPITNISKEEREGFQELNKKLTDKQIFELIDYLSSIPYINEEDAEVILLVIAYKLSSKIQTDITSESLYSVKPSGETMDMDIGNLVTNIEFSTSKIDIDDL